MKLSKLLIILSCLLITVSINADIIWLKKKIIANTKISMTEKKKLIYIVEYNNNLGFKIDNVYFLVDKKTFDNTINNSHKSYKWFNYVLCDSEILRVYKFVWVVSNYNKKSGMIDFIITTQYEDELLINSIWISFEYEALK